MTKIVAGGATIDPLIEASKGRLVIGIVANNRNQFH